MPNGSAGYKVIAANIMCPLILLYMIQAMIDTASLDHYVEITPAPNCR
jgi:hypothetical protein